MRSRLARDENVCMSQLRNSAGYSSLDSHGAHRTKDNARGGQRLTRDRQLRDTCRRNQTFTIHMNFGLELVTPSGSRAEADALLAELKAQYAHSEAGRLAAYWRTVTIDGLRVE